MPTRINYSVQADVIDIATDQPQPTDRFFVDTNVWYWVTYPLASSTNLPYPAKPYQVDNYPAYVQAAITQEAALFYSGFNFAELAHRIETTEQELSSHKRIRPKEYRHNYPAERQKVVDEVDAAWEQVINLAALLSFSLDNSTVEAATTRFQTQALDGYDLFMLETMQHHSIIQVITDDGDYITVPGIQVFTANQNVIQTAQSQKKLIKR